MIRFSERALGRLEVLVPDHTWKYFAQYPEQIKEMITKCRKDKNYAVLEQWLYIEWRVRGNNPLTEKVIFT